MKNRIILVAFALACNSVLMAQSNDTNSAKKIVEQGAKADIRIQNEQKKKQLLAPPERLVITDTVKSKIASKCLKKRKTKSRSSK